MPNGGDRVAAAATGKTRSKPAPAVPQRERSRVALYPTGDEWWVGSADWHVGPWPEERQLHTFIFTGAVEVCDETRDAADS